MTALCSIEARVLGWDEICLELHGW